MNLLLLTVLTPREESILKNCLLVLTAINAFLSYSGVELIMSETLNDVNSRIIAGVYALGSWVVLYMVWEFIAKTLPFAGVNDFIPVSIVTIFTCVFSFGLVATQTLLLCMA